MSDPTPAATRQNRGEVMPSASAMRAANEVFWYVKEHIGSLDSADLADIIDAAFAPEWLAAPDAEGWWWAVNGDRLFAVEVDDSRIRFTNGMVDSAAL